MTLSGSLWVLVDRAATSEIGRPEVYIRSAAADLTQWLDGQTFGLSMVEPAVFLSADVDETDPQWDDYWVWQVSFTQRVALKMILLQRIIYRYSVCGWGLPQILGRSMWRITI